MSSVRQFEQVGGTLCLDFANTVHCYTCAHIRDDLPDFSALVQWAQQWGLLSAREANTLVKQASLRNSEAEATLDRAKRLRAAIYYVLVSVTEKRSPRPMHLAELNAILAEGLGHIQLSVTEDHQFDWTWVKTDERLDRLLWPIARSAAELLTSDERLRIRRCSGERCTWLFMDRSKNQSRRWCDMAGCGNRAKARRYYQRNRA